MQPEFIQDNEIAAEKFNWDRMCELLGKNSYQGGAPCEPMRMVAYVRGLIAANGEQWVHERRGLVVGNWLNHIRFYFQLDPEDQLRIAKKLMTAGMLSDARDYYRAAGAKKRKK